MQSYQDWEAIVMEGRSRDNTLELLREYAKKDPRIRVFSEPDEGPYDAIWKAAGQAAGDFFCEMCFSDGYLDKDWFRKCISKMEQDPEISLVWGIPMQMSENGKLIEPNYVYAHFLESETTERKPSVFGRIMEKIDLRRPASILRLLGKINPRNARAVFHMLRKEKVPQKQEWFLYWLKTGILFPDLNMVMARKVFFECMPPYAPGTRESGDWHEFYYRFNSRGYMALCVPSIANYGRIHGGSVTEAVRKYNDQKLAKYLVKIGDLAKKVRKEPSRFFFLDRAGNRLMSLAEYENSKTRGRSGNGHA